MVVPFSSRLAVTVLALSVSSYWALGALLVPRAYTYELHYTFQDVEPKELWEHFADFGNVAKANPTIVDYKILWTTKKPKSWSYEYSVECTETLVNLPLLTNVAVANYSVGTASIDHSMSVYWINSTHLTYQNGIAFHSTDEMKFTPGLTPNKSAFLQQTIVIHCYPASNAK